ncbi:MAG: anhydro-N-acetylmuramic acid kinase [Burkholderiales bacterium]|nr:anhydro-N-acetylmuramic acid kinase [Burkholderiales bacterium]
MGTVFIGLMSGTSLDGIDGVLVDFSASGAAPFQVLAHERGEFAPELRTELLALNRPGDDEIHRAALAGNRLARGYAGVVEALLAKAGLAPEAVAAVGCHGQTVRHRPGEFDGIGYTTQINAPALLAELCRIDVVADFRSRDVAARGQGAPLVPAFHRALFARPGRATAVLNLGGIANLSAIGPDGATIGFDCGPANALLDLWCAASTGRRFDAGGAWAATGQVDARLLDSLLAEPYFVLPPPKSTGRDLFNAEWLERRLAAAEARARLRAEDVQATLAALTARTCADAVGRHAAHASELIVCGGGAFNADLLARLGSRVAPTTVVPSGDRGLPPDQVEACAFAWLARAFMAREPGNIAGVTGASGPRVLGALYPGAAPRQT